MLLVWSVVGRKGREGERDKEEGEDMIPKEEEGRSGTYTH